MSLVTLDPLAEPENHPPIDKFFVSASTSSPAPQAESVLSTFVEENWLPFIGPTALLFARRAAHHLQDLKNGEQSFSVNVVRWAVALGLGEKNGKKVVKARNRLLRFGLATWDEKSNTLYIHRYWPSPVPAAIATATHRQALLAISDDDLVDE